MANGFSIVICTNNGISRLKPTLAHLAALKIPEGGKTELILVDNASTDGTDVFVQNCWSELQAPFPLVILPENRPGKGYAIETGYDAAQYSHILTVDDDNWLAPDYLLVAQQLLQQHPDVGVLQGKNTAVFESTPPEWALKFEYNFVIGSPTQQVGYFDKNNFRVWGAGMVIEQANWIKLRKLGFAFLTSKVPGKAAGEDNETAIGLMLLGRKIYYSDKLEYQHFMPANRIAWNKLRANYEVSAYVNYFFLLYALAIDSFHNEELLNKSNIQSIFSKFFSRNLKSFTVKQHIAYWVWPRKTHYQLGLAYYYKMYKILLDNYRNSERDINFIKKWSSPLIKESNERFSWPLEL